jgi:chemotaxis protein methyltransferase CheR
MQSIAMTDYAFGDFRVWSAVSSSGEEAYSIAMVRAERPGEAPWEIVGSDLGTRVLEKARSGLYLREQSRHIPERYRRQYCRTGIGLRIGAFQAGKRFCSRVSFFQANLIEPLPEFGQFDLTVLRNVMIYFDQETKRRLVDCTVDLLRNDGHYFVGHAERLNGVTDRLHAIQAAVYRG